ncbi:hypothetical protein [uncultured Brevundimonas sp.]|uniref:hypothetical protein n=1 Tax=uncultured Brevundimonas sp. TaxID=213418 RepID=UPI0025EFE303|nr:hypothetical protein [uncultured Brevundimonas sp.]
MPGVKAPAEGTRERLADALLDVWAHVGGSTLILLDKTGSVVTWSSRIVEHRAAMFSEEGLRLANQTGEEPAPGSRPYERVLEDGSPVLDEVWLFLLGDRHRPVFVDCWPIQHTDGALMILTTPQQWALNARVPTGTAPV